MTLPVLAEGEPDESFPRELLYREIESIDENGNKIIRREEIEPIAADVRGETKAKRKKRIREETVRLAAALYGLAYDDVKQRHREQRIKMMAAISGICAGVFFIFGIVCMGLSMKINSQKIYIEQQHEELQEQYREEQIKYAESMALVSDVLLKGGRCKDAVYAVRSVMPSSIDDNEEKVYMPSTEYALSNALGTYEMDSYIPFDIEALPDDDSFWGKADGYDFINDYLDSQQIIYAYPLGDTRTLLFTNHSKTYIYDEDTSRIYESTKTTFSEPPDGYLLAAVINDNKLYMWFSQTDYMVIYKYIEPDKENFVSSISRAEMNSRGFNNLYQGDTAVSDDGKYSITIGLNNTIIITDVKKNAVIKRLYDISGSFCGLEKLGERDEYILLAGGKYSYRLNKDFDIITRIPFYYGFENDGETLLTYVYVSDTGDVDIYRQKLVTYDELIKEADSMIDGYEPTEEIKERYKMIK